MSSAARGEMESDTFWSRDSVLGGVVVVQIGHLGLGGGLVLQLSHQEVSGMKLTAWVEVLALPGTVGCPSQPGRRLRRGR